MADAQRPITVSIIGTCRVHHPLRGMVKQNLISVNNGGMDTFVHSTSEILFRLKALLKLEKYEKDLVKFQVGEGENLILEPNKDYKFNNSDILIIELSTIKAVFVEDKPLQFNEVNRHVCTPFGEFGKSLRANINNSFNTRSSSVEFPKDELPETFGEDLQNLVTRLRPLVMNSSEIAFDLDEIQRLAGIPILLVNHINLPGRDGKLITSRNRLCAIVNEYAEARKIAIFNPITLFESHKPEELLMKNGEDLNHYAKDKLDIVGLQQYHAILEALN